MVIYQKLLPRTKKRGVFYLNLKISSLNRLASYDEYPPGLSSWNRHSNTHTHTHTLTHSCWNRHSNTHTHTHTLTHICWNRHSNTHTHTHTLTHKAIHKYVR